MKRCSILLVVREMQIKNHNEYHFIFTRMTVTKKTVEPWVGDNAKELDYSYVASGNVKWYTKNSLAVFN